MTGKPLWLQFIESGHDDPPCDHAGEPGPRCDLCGEYLTPLDVMLAQGITGPDLPDMDSSWWDEGVSAHDPERDVLVDYVNAKFDSGEWS